MCPFCSSKKFIFLYREKKILFLKCKDCKEKYYIEDGEI
jgi:uncharacterized protein YbaR (Trm112 family)